MTEVISIREFARRDGCSDTLVRRAIKQGKLPTLAEGKIDAALAGSNWREDNRRANSGANTSANTVRTARCEQEETPSQAAERIVRALGADMERAEAERVKENYLALLRQLEYDQKRGALVDFQTAQSVFFECARSTRDAWLNWPARVGPMVAAELGLDAEQMTEALTKYVHQQLADLGEPDQEVFRG